MSKRLMFAVFTCFSLLLSAVFAAQPSTSGVNYVPDEDTAIAVAKAVLVPIVGDDSVEGPHALKWFATNVGDYWYVEKCAPVRMKWVTPVIRVELSPRTGRVQYLSNGANDIWVIKTPHLGKGETAPPRLEKKTLPEGARYEIHGMWLGMPNIHDVSTSGFVNDAATAMAIAKAVLRPLAGKEKVDGPGALRFYASKVDDMWYVENAPPFRKKWTTPILRVEIDRISARILNASL